MKSTFSSLPPCVLSPFSVEVRGSSAHFARAPIAQQHRDYKEGRIAEETLRFLSTSRLAFHRQLLPLQQEGGTRTYVNVRATMPSYVKSARKHTHPLSRQQGPSLSDFLSRRCGVRVLCCLLCGWRRGEGGVTCVRRDWTLKRM